ncbi:uncharacterized protein LOC131250805 isoform X3 [Magnolia sinica]|uniref:uncharacterized protein LOC131250805 isoform X3 n=1 Tax=Magnolia sinica TaxID=86752 RepID=UPI002659EA9A|nr:uncharacterized protein LOC131250805 isoform X3 [Magnolia sinica]
MQDIPPEELQTPTETLELPVVGKGPMPSAQNDDSHDDNDGDDVWGEDGSFYNVSDDGSGKTSDLDREWERRHNQFHTMASRQAKKLLHKRVSLSALSSLCLSGTNGAMLEVSPDHLKEKLVGELETREGLQNLYESVHSISMKDALQLFHDDILGSGLEQPLNHSEGNADTATTLVDISGCNQLERFSKELGSLLRKCPSIEVHAAVD